MMPLWFVILLTGALGLIIGFSAGVMVGRHSKVEQAVDRKLDYETYHPLINPEVASDKDEAQGGAP